MRRINPNSSRKGGYRYEDLYVLKLCVDWLKKPEGYKEILIQYKPDEITGRFSIDDIVLKDANDNFIFHQFNI